MAFLKSDQGGMGLDVAQDNDAKNAMQLALYRLLDEELELLKGKRLDKDYFNTLLTGGDPVRDLLQWLDLGDAFQTTRGANEWRAFVGYASHSWRSTLRLTASWPANKLALRARGPGIRFGNGTAKRRNVTPTSRAVSASANRRFLIYSSRPNRQAAGHSGTKIRRSRFQHDLLAFNHLPAHDARKRVLELRRPMPLRRELVWAELRVG